MPSIRGERTGTENLLRDGRYHYAALLADPETSHLAPLTKPRIDSLKQAATLTEDAELFRLEKQALYARAEYLHDNLQRECELDIYKSVKKNRQAPSYRKVYPQGFSALIAQSGAEQERSVKTMLKGLVAHFPTVAKKYGKDLEKLAAEASAAETALKEAEAEVGRLFVAEQLERGELFRQMRRNEGSLLSLFPDDRARVRLYFRPDGRHRDKNDVPPHSDVASDQ